MVKPDVDVASTMPVAPPSAGSARGTPPPAGGVDVAVGAGVVAAEWDDGESAVAAVAVNPATAHVSPAATSHPPVFLDSIRRTRGRRASVAVAAGADSADEWLVGS
jgi:hypothetical protein